MTLAERKELLIKLNSKLEQLKKEWSDLWDETYQRNVHQEEFDELDNEIEFTEFVILLARYPASALARASCS